MQARTAHAAHHKERIILEGQSPLLYTVFFNLVVIREKNFIGVHF